MIEYAPDTLMRALDAGDLALTPNHRTGVQLRMGYGQWRRQNGLSPVCPSPRVLPVDIWVRQQWLSLLGNGDIEGPAILEARQESLIWQNTVRDSAAAAALVNKTATAARAQDAWRTMHLWQIDRAGLAKYNVFNARDTEPDDLGAFLEWIEAFERFCRKQDLISLSPLVREIATRLENGTLGIDGRVHFCGFQDPPPLYARLIKAIDANAADCCHVSFSVCSPAVEIRACLDADQEILQAARWAAAITGAEPDARIGIICPDLNTRRDAVERQFWGIFHPDDSVTVQARQSARFHVDDRRPLARYPLILDALALLELNQPWVDTLAVCALLRSPFLTGADAEEDARAALEFKLRKDGELKVQPTRVCELAGREELPCHSPVLGDALLGLRSLRGQAAARMSCRAWCDLFEKQLALFGWPGDRPLTAAESGQLKTWYECLESVHQVAHWHGNLGLDEALSLLRQMAANTTVPARDDTAPVLILTPTEADGLRFTHLWCMGLSEQQWPPSTRPSPFIPLPLQREARLPEADVRLQTQQAKQRLAALIDNTASAVIFSHPCQADDIRLKPAAMLAAFGGRHGEPEGDMMPLLHPRTRDMLATGSTERFTDAATLPLLSDEQATGGVAVIADQADCPFKGVARHRLGADPLPAPLLGLPGHALGSMLHEALETLWGALVDQQSLLSRDAGSLASLVEDAVAGSIRNTARRYPYTMTAGFMHLEKQRLRQLLLDWLDQERQRGPFRVLESERDMSWTHRGLRLDLRIDRIDQTADGNLVVVDYKSSIGSEINWTRERQTEPQLMLYLLAVEKSLARPVDGIFIAQVNIEDNRYKGISTDNVIYPRSHFGGKRLQQDFAAWRDLKEYWETSMTGLAEQFLAGYVAVDPVSVNSSCTWCHLQGLCRINDEVPA